MSSFSNYTYTLLKNFGYYGIYLVLLIEGTGLPIPVQLIFIAATYFISKRVMSFYYIIAAMTLGNLSGNVLAYFIGYYGGKPAMRRVCKLLHINYDDIEKVGGWYKKYGGYTTMLSRWIGITRTPAIWASGLFEVNLLSYGISCLIGDLVWAVFWLFLYTKASSILSLLTLKLEHKLLIIFLLIAIICLAWWLFIKYFKGKMKAC